MKAMAAAPAAEMKAGAAASKGAGALAVAALMSGKIEPSGATPGAGTTPGTGKMSSAGTTVAVISGGNIDVNLLDRLVDRGLVADGRRKRLTVATANVPGELVRISGAMAEARANIVQVEHDLAAPDLPVGVSRITLVIELPQAEVYERVREHLIAAGLSEAELTDFQTSAAANRPS